MLYYNLQEFSFFFQIWEPDIHFKNEKLMFNCLIVTNGIMWVLDRLMQVGILRLWEQTAILFCGQLAKTFKSIRSFTYKFTGLLIDIQILGYHKISWQRTEISPGFFSYFFLSQVPGSIYLLTKNSIIGAEQVNELREFHLVFKFLNCLIYLYSQ